LHTLCDLGRARTLRRIALELLKDPKIAEALTRRLSIICLEDGLLHPQLPLVVWTMMALVRLPPSGCFCCCASSSLAVGMLLLTFTSVCHKRDGGHARCGCFLVRTLLAVHLLWRSCVLCEAHLHQHVDGSFACRVGFVVPGSILVPTWSALTLRTRRTV
jgi:hypothetical protein